MTECSQVTKFVVDAQRKYILINKHVIYVNLFLKYCVFKNHEKICIKFMFNTCEYVNFECDTNICITKYEICLIYCDLIYDFDYFKFNLMIIKYMKIIKLKLKSEFVHMNIKI